MNNNSTEEQIFAEDLLTLDEYAGLGHEDFS